MTLFGFPAPMGRQVQAQAQVFMCIVTPSGFSVQQLNTWSLFLSAKIDYCLFRFVPFCSAVLGSTRVYMSSDPDDPKNKQRNRSGNDPVEPSPFLFLCLLFRPSIPPILLLKLAVPIGVT